MEIKAADVMKLRKMTGAGMMDCKKALMEAEGDYARAQDIIREKGKLVVAKRADRTATEGVVVTKIVGQKAYILCLACETDFVAQNAEYTASANAMLDVAVKNDAADRDALMATKNDEGRTVEEMVTEKSGQTGEKIELAAVLLVDGATVTTDADSLAKVKVTAEVIGNLRGPKIIIQKYKNKTGYKKRQGHRQDLTRIKVTGIK